MPMERERYPKNWEEIALNVKRDADWKCQRCGKQCRPGYLSIAEWLKTQTHQPDYEDRDAVTCWRPRPKIGCASRSC